jgi:hypothetical protein
MNQKAVIHTNFARELLLGTILLVITIAIMVIYKNIWSFISFIIVFAGNVQYFLSKKVIQIIIEKDWVTFKYFQFKKAKHSCNINSIKIIKQSEVHFRGGRNELYFINDKANNRTMFKISKRSFKTEEDYKLFTRYFPTSTLQTARGGAL